jgi:DNA-binding transcriptional LysR family regulator
MQQRIAWDDLRLVLAVGRAGSLSGAARILNLDHSTLHRRIGQIERRLGVRLFERSRTGYAPTPAGEVALEAGESMDARVLTLETRIAGQDLRPSGHVRITTSDTVACTVLTPILREFRIAHPEITLEVGTTSEYMSLTRREADVAVRVTANPPEHLVGRRAGRATAEAYASGEYLAALSGADLSDPNIHAWIGFDERLMDMQAARWMAQTVPAARIGYRIDNVPAMAEAAKAGLGVAILPDFLARRDATLSKLSPSPCPPIVSEFWVLTHPELRRTARIAVLMTFLADRLSKIVPDTRRQGRRPAID